MTEWGKALRPTVHDLVKEIDEFKEQTNQNIASINEGIDALQTDIASINDGIDALQIDKADKIGYYKNLIAGAANTLFGSDAETEMFAQRISANDGMVRIENVKGNAVVWNQLVGASDTSVTVPSGHRYLSRIGGTASIATSMGAAIAVTGGTDNIFDLTLMFGSGNEPATVQEFEAMYPASYYPYDAGTMLPVRVEGVETTDADGDPLFARAIPASTYFPDGMRSAGTVRDELTAGQAVKRVGAVDLGTLNWSVLSTPNDHVFRALMPSDTAIPDRFSLPNAICANYASNTWATLSTSNDKQFAIGVISMEKRISIIDSSFSTNDAFVNAVNGVILYYELATPTTTQIDPPLNLTYPTQQRGTESIVIPTGESSAPPVLVTTQAVNTDGVRDIALSQIAVIENGNASANYSVGDYLIHSGILYRVTRAIANGEAIIAGTNVTTTTVMDELVRLTS